MSGKDIHETETGVDKLCCIGKGADREACVQMKGKVEYKMKVKDNGRRNETIPTL